ncbi:PEP-CTERM sorting domain-containing protein [Massilia sp. Root418]|uniref:PEP-CTERM sorting domain-containing protein n=1 Tax=Massilia sp. Root418 TaxID=1736532 RepID=UPI0009E9380D|nr:PEP-CTERM sorting domain-containing protein [Massilia sp. Root418]
MTPSRCVLALLSCPLLAAPALAEGPRYSMTRLSADGGSANVINNAGQVAGMTRDPASGAMRAYLWRDGVQTLLDTPINVVQALSADGKIAGNISSFDPEDFQTRPAIYAHGATTFLPPLAGTPMSGYAEGINTAGMVAGSQTINGHSMAYLSHNGVSTALGTLGGAYSYARGMNEAGMVVGGSAPASGKAHAFLYHGGTMVDLGTLDPDGTAAAEAVNASGVAVGYSWLTSVERYRATIFQNGTAAPLGEFGDYEHSLALDINDAGQVIGAGDNGDTFLYQDGVTYDLATLVPGDAGYRLTSVSSINNSGQIAGTACGSSACFGVLLSPVPEPGSIALLLAGLGLLYGLRRRAPPV